MTDTVAPNSVASLAGIPRLPNGQQPRKLRDSCIHCANSKVKCNKEKPVCSRCVRRRLTCEYKVSRRTGRTSRVASNNPGATSTTRRKTTPESQSHRLHQGPRINTSLSIAPSQTPLLTPTTTVPTAHSSPEHCQPETPDLWCSIISPTALGPDDFSSLMPLGPDVSDIFGSVIPSPQFNSGELDVLVNQGTGDSPSVADPPLFSTSGLPDINSPCFSSGPSRPQVCCLATLFTTFMNLFPNAPNVCKRPGSQAGPGKVRTIESVILENKQAIETINMVLDCPCSQDEYVISIASLAVFKIMNWYVAAARDRTSTTEDHNKNYHHHINNLGWGNELTSHSTCELTPSSFDEQVLHLPAVVGNYCIQGNDQGRMTAQLVLGELHQVQRLVKLISSRLETIRQRNCFSSGSTSSCNILSEASDVPPLTGGRMSALSSATLSNLEEDLRRRLRTISSETIESLRRS